MIDPQHIQYCLTVPAMWTDAAKGVMRRTAIEAGLIQPQDPPHRLLLVSEPEAAAMYCERKCEQFNLRQGDRFMICDAGGTSTIFFVIEQIRHHGMVLSLLYLLLLLQPFFVPI